MRIELLWFSRNHKKRHNKTNARTYEPANQQTRIITIAPSGGDDESPRSCKDNYTLQRRNWTQKWTISSTQYVLKPIVESVTAITSRRGYSSASICGLTAYSHSHFSRTTYSQWRWQFFKACRPSPTRGQILVHNANGSFPTCCKPNCNANSLTPCKPQVQSIQV